MRKKCMHTNISGILKRDIFIGGQIDDISLDGNFVCFAKILYRISQGSLVFSGVELGDIVRKLDFLLFSLNLRKEVSGCRSKIDIHCIQYHHQHTPHPQKKELHIIEENFVNMEGIVDFLCTMTQKSKFGMHNNEKMKNEKL